MPNIGLLLNKPMPCPNGCRHMVLKTPAERQRGYCVFCAMTTHRHLSGFKLITSGERVAYRTEAKAYNEGIFDDD